MDGAKLDSPLPLSDEMHLCLQSDIALSRDARMQVAEHGGQPSADDNQLPVGHAYVARLAVVGHSPKELIDCSDVIPAPVLPSRNRRSGQHCQ